MLKSFQMVQELCVCTMHKCERQRQRDTKRVHENAPISVLDRKNGEKEKV